MFLCQEEFSFRRLNASFWTVRRMNDFLWTVRRMNDFLWTDRRMDGFLWTDRRMNGFKTVSGFAVVMMERPLPCAPGGDGETAWRYH